MKRLNLAVGLEDFLLFFKTAAQSGELAQLSQDALFQSTRRKTLNTKGESPECGECEPGYFRLLQVRPVWPWPCSVGFEP